MNKVTLSLYRSLVRVVHQYEKHPELYSMLYTMKTGSLESSRAEVYYLNKLEEVFANAYLFPLKSNPSYFRTLIRNEFKTTNDTRLPTRIAAGFTALRRLSSVWTSYLNEKSASSMLPSPNVAGTPLKNVAYSDDLMAGTFLIASPLLSGALKRGILDQQ